MNHVVRVRHKVTQAHANPTCREQHFCIQIIELSLRRRLGIGAKRARSFPTCPHANWPDPASLFGSFLNYAL